MSTPRPHEPSGSPVDQLLETAFRVFAERGYRATRLEEVAEAAGVTKGAIYHYFDGKEDLLRRALQYRHRAMFAEIARALAQEQAPAAVRIRFVLRKIWQHWMEPGWGHAFRLLLGEVSVEVPEAFRLWAAEGPIHGWTMLRELIEEGVRAGEFRPDADAEVARIMISGLMMQAALRGPADLAEIAPCDPDRVFDSAIDCFLHGLSVVHGLPPQG